MWPHRVVLGGFLAVMGTACTMEEPTEPAALRASVSAANPRPTFFVQLSGGTYPPCGVTLGLAAFCWGANFNGQLGDGTTTDHLTPAAVTGGLSLVAVSASRWGGGFYTCGLTASGAAYCWGNNDTGQLGDGTSTSSSTPVAVTGGLTFVALSAGAVHTCGLTTGGAAYCWGQGLVGQLGDGTTNSSPSPVAVKGGLTFVAISAGGSHTCGLTRSGSAFCWGEDDRDQLGIGAPAPEICGPSVLCSTVPVAVAGGLRFWALSPGLDYTCGLTGSGAAYCWGGNDTGELGDGTTTQHSSPVAVTGGRRFFALTAGFDHTCGLTRSLAAYCWGSNSFGQMGLGLIDFIPHLSPVPVTGGLRFFALSAGQDHTCGLTAAFPPRAYCWGSNRFGQLGDGTTMTSPSPILVLGP